MKLSTRLLFFWTVSFCVIHGLGASDELENTESATAPLTFREEYGLNYLMERYGPMRFKYTFVDENGVLVEDVMFSVRYMAFGEPDTRFSGVANMEWEWSSDVCNQFNISFRKKGYHPVNRSYSYNNEITRDQTPVKPTIDGLSKTYEEQVVMREVGPVGDIKRHGITINGKEDEWSDVAYLGYPKPNLILPTPPPGEKTPDWVLEIYNIKTEKKLVDTPCVPLTEGIEDMPAGLHIRLVNSTGEEMEVKHLKHVIAPKNKNLFLCLNSSDPDDGLILLPPMNKDYLFGQNKIRNGFIEMKDAPEKGYQEKILIDRKHLSDTTGRELTIQHFYIRLNGLYGKGYISDGTYRDGDLSVSLSIYLQHDGSRNVRYAH